MPSLPAAHSGKAPSLVWSFAVSHLITGHFQDICKAEAGVCFHFSSFEVNCQLKRGQHWLAFELLALAMSENENDDNMKEEE